MEFLGSCSNLKNCSINQRCVTGKCQCKFGHSEKSNQNGRTRKRSECLPFACTEDDACDYQFGRHTNCVHFTCVCASGTVLDEKTQKCVFANKLTVENANSDFDMSKWILWQWRTPENNLSKENIQAGTSNVINLPLKCNTDLPCLQQFGTKAFCAPIKRQCYFRSEESNNNTWVRWMVVVIIIAVAIFVVCRSSNKSENDF